MCIVEIFLFCVVVVFFFFLYSFCVECDVHFVRFEALEFLDPGLDLHLNVKVVGERFG